MLGIDLAETQDVAFPKDVTWTVGLLPLVKLDTLLDAVEKARKPFLAHSAEHRPTGEKPTPEEYAATAEAIAHCPTCTELLAAAEAELRPVYREAVRWGLRATTAAIPLATESVKLAGKEYSVLTEASVEKLIRVRHLGNSIIGRLASEIIAANQLDERTILGFS